MLILRFPTMTHFRVRALEWQITGITLLTAVILLDPYKTLDSPVFTGMRQWGDDIFWATVLGIVGLARLFALWRNGGWIPSPWIRCVTAAVSASIWGVVTLNIAQAQWALLIMAPFIIMVLSDVYSVGRAASDARLTRDDRLKQPEAPRVMLVS